MKLGPLQKKWVKELKNHPERWAINKLGFIEESGNVNLCCLGQCLVILDNIDLKTFRGGIEDSDGGLEFTRDDVLEFSFEKIGLRSPEGRLDDSVLPEDHIMRHRSWETLAAINDNSYFEDIYLHNGKYNPWLLIAETMEKYPKWAFTKSV